MLDINIANRKILNILILLFLLLGFLFQPAILNPVYGNFVYSKINWDEILKESQYILEKNERDILANFRYSIALANLGLILEAFENFDYIKEFISLSEFNATINPYIKGVDEKSEDVILLNYAAFAYVINGNYNNSVKYFQKIIEIEPANIWIRNLLAAAYLELSDYNSSKREARKALEIKENKYSHLILAIAYYRTGNYINSLLELHSAGDLARKVINF